jgi:hypothetical protein
MTHHDDQVESLKTLRTYTDRVVEDLKEYIDAKITDRDDSVKSAVDAMNERLAGMNEFRNSLRDTQTNYMPRTEYDARHQQITDQINSLSKLVYTGMGLILALEFLLKFFVK